MGEDTVLVEFGADYGLCKQEDPAAAELFWEIKLDEARELISTVHERPSVKVQIKAQKRVNEMKDADTARAEEQSERAALEAHAAVLVSTWSSTNPTLRLKLLALPTLLTDTQVTDALTTVTSCLRDSNGEESAVV